MMSAARPDYFDRYPTISFERDAEGILTIWIHCDGVCVLDIRSIMSGQ